MAHATTAAPEQGASHSGHYVAPKKLLLKVFGGLIFFTLLTAATGVADWIPSWMHIPLALAIAGVKTVLVVMFFMGLKHDNRVNTLALVLPVIFVTIFLTFTLFDTVFRGDLGNVDTMTVADRELLQTEDSTRLLQTRGLQVAPGDYRTADSSGSAVTGTMMPDSTGNTSTTTTTVAPPAGSSPPATTPQNAPSTGATGTN